GFALVAWRALPAGGQPDTPPPPDQHPVADAGPPSDQPPAPDAAPPSAEQAIAPAEPEPPPAEPEPAPSGFERNLAGSIQLDVMSIPSRDTGRDVALDSATAEVSIKITNDFSSTLSASV